MSSYYAKAYHPKTGKLEEAMFVDDYYDHHSYGVKFGDQSVYPIEKVKIPKVRP